MEITVPRTLSIDRRVLTRVTLALICAVNLWATRASLRDVPPFNDEVMHSQMVRFATNSLLHFHWPFTQWYPYLNAGGPQFLHYQGLGATFTGLLGVFVGSSWAFRLSLWLLVGLWPLAIYLASRVFQLPVSAGLLAAALAPSLSSVPQIGYEPHAYLWLGYGVWAQLWASWALPFAWAWSWRALREPRHLWKAALAISLTCGLHYETGYAAFLGLAVITVASWQHFRQRLKNAAILIVGSALATAWILVPLLTLAPWAAINSGQNTTDWALGYGARTNLKWLVTGNYFDHLRLPVISLLLAVAVIAALWGWRRFPTQRALLVLGAVIFLISFGPTTWHGFIALVPGHHDIFFRRFLGPVQLAGLFVAGCAPAMVLELLANRGPRIERARQVVAPLAVVLSLVIMVVSFASTSTYYQKNARSVNHQLAMQAHDEPSLTPIIQYLQANPNARVYVGNQTNWGHRLNFGVGPMYMYLADADITQTSTQAWSASLLEVPQEMFDPTNLSDYQIFDVQFIITPPDVTPDVDATRVLTSGKYVLWRVANVGPLSILSDTGSLSQNKGTIVKRANETLRTHYFEQHAGFVVNYPGDSPVVNYPSVPTAEVGHVAQATVDLTTGYAQAIVTMNQPGALVLSTSFDPGWRVNVDGATAATEMIAPALVAVHLEPGVHQVTFAYRGYQWYLPLIIISSGAVIGLWWFYARREKRRG